jgi:hypothetical protein
MKPWRGRAAATLVLSLSCTQQIHLIVAKGGLRTTKISRMILVILTPGNQTPFSIEAKDMIRDEFL